MTTQCSICGKNITENEKQDDDFVLCNHCNRFTAKSSHHFKEIPLEQKVIKEKGVKTGPFIIQMLKDGKKVSEITNQIVCKASYVRMLKYKLIKGIIK